MRPAMRERIALSWRPLGRLDPVDLFRRAAAGRMGFFLDSSSREPGLTRNSFVGWDPIGWFRSRAGRSAYACPWGEAILRGDPLDALAAFLGLLPFGRVGRPPVPFAAGLVGTFSYDLGRWIERIPDEKAADLQIPDIHLGLYSRIVHIDHAWGEAYEIGPRIPLSYEPPPIPDDLRVPQEPAAIPPLDREAFVRSIATAKEAIADGEIFQANLSHRLGLPLEGTPAEAYERLRTRTPAAFAAYLDAGDHRILSASPERFLQVRGREVETRPVKGTRPRGRTAAEDRALARELLDSEKDAAENVMIVDLERNDLGKVCTFGSVRVPSLLSLRSLPTVHHLESVVRGTLREDVGVPELLRATFPGGSITGAPKPRAMEIIERLEPHRRGVYTGAIGYISLDGSLDLNLAIRTATVLGRTAYFAVGGGIVADSDPEAEYQETLDKLRGHAEALTRGRTEVAEHGIRLA